ncbi:thioredoxin family protein [Candidatus Dojkabacteria bacterium]|uniref:Thioredoxin family protein n=1 Tax=Candidatus Dojkabacteria bacterium TaxID=2099670 RepID=A0A955I7U3_9BACT|nr:thioredoxin family protein [Candidatus Dojkabacteria bacterium]
MKILKFGAVWCSGCLVMKPRWKEIEEENPDLKAEYFDVDEHPELVEQYKIEDFPTFIFLSKNDDEVHREVGEVSKKKLLELIEKYKNL